MWRVGRINRHARRLAGRPPQPHTTHLPARSLSHHSPAHSRPPTRLAPPLCRRLKKEVFGANTFWVTGSAPSPNGGLLVRGNLRGPAADIFAKVQAKCAEMFGECCLGGSGADVVGTGWPWPSILALRAQVR